jgi:heme exporter protein CcmD
MMNAFLNVVMMQGYGAYIWGSVFITGFILVGNFWYARYQYKTLQKKVKDNQP